QRRGKRSRGKSKRAGQRLPGIGSETNAQCWSSVVWSGRRGDAGGGYAGGGNARAESCCPIAQEGDGRRARRRDSREHGDVFVAAAGSRLLERGRPRRQR